MVGFGLWSLALPGVWSGQVCGPEAVDFLIAGVTGFCVNTTAYLWESAGLQGWLLTPHSQVLRRPRPLPGRSPIHLPRGNLKAKYRMIVVLWLIQLTAIHH